MKGARQGRNKDHSWGKTNLIMATYQMMKELYKPRTQEGEAFLKFAVALGYKKALENDSFGFTLLEYTQSTPKREEKTKEMIAKSAFQGIPVICHSKFISNLDEIAEFPLPQEKIISLGQLIADTDLKTHRIMLILLGGERAYEALISAFPIESIEDSLRSV